MNSGIVFLGTPHPSFRRRKEWARLNLILQCSINTSKIILAQGELEANQVAHLSLEFEEVPIEAPIISAYENKATKVSGKWLMYKKQIVRKLKPPPRPSPYQIKLWSFNFQSPAC
jgi:hypothetical protein